MSSRTFVIWSVLIVVFFTVLTWKGERDSCMRQTGVRSATADVALTAAAARTQDADIALAHGNDKGYERFIGLAEQYKADARKSSPLDCSGVFPDTH